MTKLQGRDLTVNSGFHPLALR